MTYTENTFGETIQKRRNKLNYMFFKTDTPYREQTSDYQWGEGMGEGQDIDRGLRGTNYYV